MNEWVNWSGSLKFTPSAFLQPRSEDELADAIRESARNGKRIRVAGAGHSSSSLVETNDTLIQLKNFKGIVRADERNGTATLRTGMTVGEANDALQELGLALFNTGDVDVQMLTGAISTGTHGSGKRLQNLSSMLVGVRMITSEGDVRNVSQEADPELMKSVRVALGTLGIFTEITVRVLPLFKLRRVELCTDIETCLSHFDGLADENRNVDFYWYPRSDEAKIRILNEPGRGSERFPFSFNCKENTEDWVGKILPKERVLKFDEMEYALPYEQGIPCFREVRRRVLERHRKDVAWRVLFRTIARDDNHISPHHGRDSVSISLHHNAGLPYDTYFSDIEPIFQRYGGRPHWGKKHSLRADELRKLYPEWERFQEVRRNFDKRGLFINNYLKEILEV